MNTHPLKLERDLVFLDTETTGIDLQTDRIVEIALVWLKPDGARTEYRTLVNPEIPIPEESRRVHNISDEMVAGAPTFAELAPRLLEFLRDVDVAGYNVARFDIPILRAEFERARIDWRPEGMRVVDAQLIYHRMEPRDLSAACRFYVGRDHVGAHGALADTHASLDVLLAQLEKYPDLPRDVVGLDTLFNQPDRRFVDSGRKFKWRDGEPAFNFGHHRGKPLRQVVADDPEYMDWILAKDFPNDVKKLVKDALMGVIPRLNKAAGEAASEGASGPGAAAGASGGSDAVRAPGV